MPPMHLDNIIFKPSGTMNTDEVPPPLPPKKYKYKPIQKIQYFNDQSRKQTALKQLTHLQNKQTNILIPVISKCLEKNNKLQIAKCFRALSNMLSTNYCHEVQGIAHVFIPSVFRLLTSHQSYDIRQLAIDFLRSVTSFGNLNEESVELFRQKGVDIVVNMLKYLTKQKCYQKSMHWLMLLGNLTIDNIILRNKLIEKGVIDIILEISQKSQPHVYSIPIQSKQTTAIIFALMACLGDPFPPKPQTQKAYSRVLKELNSRISVSLMICQHLKWFTYNHYDFRDQQQCTQLLQALINIYIHKNSDYYSNTLDKSFNPIYREIYKFYYQKDPNSPIVHRLHGNCYIGRRCNNKESKIMTRQFTPKICMDFFKTALQHRLKKISFGLDRPWRFAVSLLKKPEQVENQLLGLKFISWVLRPLVVGSNSEHWGFPKYQRLKFEDEEFIRKDLLAYLREELFLCQLVNDSEPMVEQLSKEINKKYYEFISYDQLKFRLYIEV